MLPPEEKRDQRGDERDNHTLQRKDDDAHPSLQQREPYFNRLVAIDHTLQSAHDQQDDDDDEDHPDDS